MNTRERILSESELLFKKYGARNIKVEDIATRLSISKKTIYQYFKDKDALVYEVTKLFLLHIEHKMELFR
jgi:AcrR family transcriptional regulator